MPLDELPNELRTCVNCIDRGSCYPNSTSRCRARTMWSESFESFRERAEKRVAELEARSKQGATECSQCGLPLSGPPKVCFNCTPTWGLEQQTRAEAVERDRDEWKNDALRWRREARALRGIVQEDHPDELEVLRGLRSWHAKERRRRREAERERDEALAEVAKLKTLLTEIANEPDWCVLCGADTRQQKDCKSCGTDHTGSRRCFRRGEHDPECGLKPYETIRRKDGA
jgi:hypothetical protein